MMHKGTQRKVAIFRAVWAEMSRRSGTGAPMTVRSIAQTVGRPYETVYRAFRELQRLGYVRFEGQGAWVVDVPLWEVRG